MAGRARAREHRRHVDHPQTFERLHARRLLTGVRFLQAALFETVVVVAAPAPRPDGELLHHSFERVRRCHPSRVGEEADEHVLPGVRSMSSHACCWGDRPVIPPMPGIDVNGGGPAGGGVPGGVRKNFFASSTVLPGASFTITSSWICAPWFEMSTGPLPVNPGGRVNEKSPSVIVESDFGADSLGPRRCSRPSPG